MLLIVSASAATSPLASRTNFWFEIAVGDRGHDFHDTAHLLGQVRRHEVHVVGEIFPRSGDAGHFGLGAQFSFDTDFASDRGHLIGEGAKRVGHVVDRFGESRHFAFGFENKFLIQVTVSDRGHDFHDTAHLLGEIRRHEVHVVGEIFPSARDAVHIGLTAQFSFRTDFFRDASHFRREGVQLVHHHVDRVFQLEDFAFRVDRDLLRQVALATAVVTFAMLRTWAVRLPAS